MLENRLGRRHPLVQLVMDNWVYFVIALVMWRLPYWLGDHFNSPITNLGPRDLRANKALSWMAVAIEVYNLAILAMSYNLIFGFAGILSFGHALFWGTGVYAMIIFIIQYSQSVAVSIGMALAISALFGLIAALAAFRIRGVYFAMFTLALAQIFFELSRVNMFRFLTNGDDGLRFSTETTPGISLSVNRLDLYYVTAFAMAATFLFIRRLMNSPTGKVIIAIRDNEDRTQTMGYNVYLHKALVIVLASLLATLAGVLHALSTKGAEPSALSVVRTVDPLLMTIIGGTGTNPGPVIGAAALRLGETFFSKPDLHIDLNFTLFRYAAVVDTKANWRLALGIVFILIVMLVPYGLVGQINRLWIQTRRWCRRYVYDPLVRRHPALAATMEPLSGEPAAVALALAHQSAGASLRRWALDYPATALYVAIIALALAASLGAWDAQTGLDLFLFFGLLALPAVAVNWASRNRGVLKDKAHDLALRIGLQRGGGSL
jgi:branched-chain amino acid transport system permease protein